MQSSPFLRLGSRGSALALAQARLVRARLAIAHGVNEAAIPISTIVTSGDRLAEARLADIGGKGLFSKEIEAALLAGEIDIGVHSSKDLATALPAGLALAGFLEREDRRDAFVSLTSANLDDLPRGAHFGTSSLRRAAQILRARPDLVIVPFRGNVDTRLQKLRDGVAAATLLAVAGLNRLDRAGEITAYLDPERFLPAPAQGAIGLEIRGDDARTAALVAPLDHAPTRTAILAERALLGALDGSCRTAIGVLSHIENQTLRLRAELVAADGGRTVAGALTGPDAAPEALGQALGALLRDKAGADFAHLWGSA